MHSLRSIACFGLAAVVAYASPSQAQQAEPWVLKGRVIDAQGRPVVGARIVADNELLHNSNVTGTTGPDGRYRIQLPHIHVTWNASGSAVRTVAGEKIDTNLSPNTEASFAGRAGAVRDFTLRSSGERNGGGHYGASVVVYSEPGSVFDTLGVQLRFEPLDGGVAFTAAVKRTGDGNAVPDVPVDRYRISATYNGRPLSIRLRNEGDFGPYVEPKFHKVASTLYDLSLEVR